MASSDSLFHALPEPLQQLIDEVFTTTANPNYSPSSTRYSRKHEATPPAGSSHAHAGGGFIAEESSGGGFIVEDEPTGGGGFLIDDEPTGGGGFLVEDSHAQPSTSTGGGFLLADTSPGPDTDTPPHRIPLELVPAALQRLDLPPDDDEILAVFRNAASGWATAATAPPAVGGGVGADEGQGLYVAREDWRSVCAVLMEGTAGEYAARGDGDGDDGSRDRSAFEARMDVEEEDQEEEEEEDGDMSDDYVGPASASSSLSSVSDSDDEYRADAPSTRQRRGRPRNGLRQASLPQPATAPGKPTRRQQQAALEAFALFFNETDVRAEDVPGQRIGVADIQRVAKLLREQIKAEEMLDMLDMFSTSADKSVDLEDFTQMMIMAKLA